MHSRALVPSPKKPSRPHTLTTTLVRTVLFATLVDVFWVGLTVKRAPSKPLDAIVAERHR